MKKRIFILVAIAFSLSACEDGISNAVDTGGNTAQIIEVDSCEYVLCRYYQNSVSVVHHQNCKFCKGRNSHGK